MWLCVDEYIFFDFTKDGYWQPAKITNTKHR